MIGEPTPVPSLPSAELIQKLRRLGLVDDADRLPELDGTVPEAMQRTLLPRTGTRSVIRLWSDARTSNRRLPTTALLLVLDHLRGNPSEAGTILKSLTGIDLDAGLAECSLEAARALHENGRTQFAQANIDVSVNFMLEAQRELLFAVTSGRLSGAREMEALGRYAVAVAFSSRWIRTDQATLLRAHRFHVASISRGNRAPEAYSYLVELLSELFNQTGEVDYLREALTVASSRGLSISHADILLKFGVLKIEEETGGAIADLQQASVLAQSARPQSGVEYVQRALIQEMALSAILGRCPLSARNIRLPYGFLLELPRLPAATFESLSRIVLDALSPMRADLRERRRRPNLVAQQILSSVLRETLLRSHLANKDIADLLVEIVAETAAAQPTDRHLRWRHAEALLSRALLTRRPEQASEAVEVARKLLEEFPSWPLPHVTLARSLQVLREVAVPSESGATIDPGAAWQQATRLVVDCPEFRRSDLGGRSGVFAVEDARGDLSSAFVFKPVTSEQSGQREAAQLAMLARAISESGSEDRFGAPVSLGVFPATDGSFVHVIERQIGHVLASLDTATAAKYLPACVELIALFHRACDRPAEGRSGWPALKDGLKLWCKALFSDPAQANLFIGDLKTALPTLPLVLKRDAHAGNWVIDSAHRVIAIDLEGVAAVPAGHDIAQLVEDAALLPVSEAGFAERYSLVRKYVSCINLGLDPGQIELAYDWFALYRAIWLATSASATKAQHSHARLLAHHIATTTELDQLRSPAQMASAAMRKMTLPDTGTEILDLTQRRLSKAMSSVLRHRAPSLGLRPDEGGFIPVEALASVLGQPIESILAVAAHPAEPRFQVSDGMIRALYGHSFVVADLHEINVQLPPTLYHASSWNSLSQIALQGLRPMSRQYVHLTNNPAEAVQVARRHGHPILLAVSTAEVSALRAVADAVWAAESVDPASVHIRNLFADIPVASEWLTPTGSMPPLSLG